MFARRGQSIIEYTVLVGILTMVFYYMGTSIKRGVQSLVKVTADQVGNQQNADQDFNDIQQGYLVGSNTHMQEIRNDQTAEAGWRDSAAPYTPHTVVNMVFNESSVIMTNSITNAGFTPDQ